MSSEKQLPPEQMQVQKSAEPAKVLGFSYFAQSTFYDWTKILSIVPAKILCDGIKGLITSQEAALGSTMVGYGASIFKTSLAFDDVFVGVIGRAASVYLGKAYGDPLQAFEKMTGTKTFLHTPEDNLRSGRIGEYLLQRVLYTSSTNFLSTACGIAAKVVFLGMVLPNTFPALCAVYASTYCAILTARVVADMIQDVLGVSSLNPDRKNLLDSLQEARNRASQKAMPSGGAPAHA